MTKPRDILHISSSLGSNACGLCRARGALVCLHDGEIEWCTCPACGGRGARAVHGRPEIRTGGKRKG